MKEIVDGTKLNLAAFGPAFVRKLYVHPDTRELVADVYAIKAKESMHSSLAYCRRVAQ